VGRRPGRARFVPSVVVAALVVATTATGCIGGGDDRGRPEAPVSEGRLGRDEVVRIMPLGDSLTEGGDPSQPTSSPQSYRGYLEARLTAAGYRVDFVGSQRRPAIGGTDPDHEGHGGFTIGPDSSTSCAGCGPANLDAGIATWLRDAQPDVILLMIGVNDVLGGAVSGQAGDAEPAAAAGKLRALVRRIRVLAPGTTIVVASYPPVRFLVEATPAGSSTGGASAFAELNVAAAELAEQGDDRIVYAPMAEAFAGSWDAVDVLRSVGDELHPSASGAKRIADVWFRTLDPLLKD